MKAFKFLATIVFAVTVSFGLSAPTAKAADFPKKEITIIVSWKAGGGTDIIARQLAHYMEQELGKSVIVLNKPGGGGTVGFAEMAKAKPDGYTLGMTTNSMLLQKYMSVNYIDYKKFNHFTMVNEDPASLTVPANAKWNTMQEFIEDAKKNPGKFRISNAGPGTSMHAVALQLEKLTGVEFVHVPYEGGNPAAVAVAGGHVEATVVSPAECASLVEAGKLKILAVAAVERLPKLLNVPTYKECGYDLAAGVWRAIAAPKGTPKDVIAVLESAVKKAMERKEYRDFLATGGYGYRYIGSEEMQKYIDNQSAEYDELFKDIEL
jgi:tripartite-type tricarboxylate transporter receptor subunit TctC